MAKLKFPQPLSLKKMIGPSFIILALGLGSGEIILWPYLVANYGLGVAWGAVLGISFQFFINMEIERYALVKGESVFVGIARLFPKAIYWFIVSTFIGFGLPGIVAASAQVLASVFGWADFRWLAIALLLLIGVILTVGRTIYNLMEHITKIIIFVGVPFIFILAIYFGTADGWLALGQGLIGKGEGFWFLAPGIAIATFLGAFAYSGAGGNLNLTQSIYIKEKGYGMGAYAQKIAGLFAQRGKKQEVKLSGEDFEINQENISIFKKWWRLINLEHLIVFWLIGTISMTMLMFLAYSTVYGLSGNAEGINFVISEGSRIGLLTNPLLGLFFLVVVGIMLFQTQLGIMDSTSRIMSENAALEKLRRSGDNKVNLSKIYYIFVWAQIAFGITLFLLDFYEPKSLIVLGAVINAVAMLVHVVLVTILNRRALAKPFQPALWRRIILGVVIAFFAVFSVVVIKAQLF
ncbi:MAG TPA: Nramp family divalent metal transporter [bacterium]|nr:Nramp family divalent metal transporter [bacterium]HQQ38649.1 Nramp family divalent metal transporter [bacterium]